MKEFKAAELEIILFEDDIVTASSCAHYICQGVGCMCNGQQYCAQVT